MKINERIKIRRKELGLTLEDVAEAMGVSISLISRYESNDVKNMGIDKIEPLAKILKTTPTYLLGWEEEDKRIANLNIEELSQLDKILNETTLFFNAEDITDEDKVLLRKALMEVFFKELDKIKKK